MSLIVVSEGEKKREAKAKPLSVETDVWSLVERYRDFLVTFQGGDPRKFTESRIVNDVLRAAFKGDKEFQEWLKKAARLDDSVSGNVTAKGRKEEFAGTLVGAVSK